MNLFCREWISHAPPENILRVLVCVRIMMRDPSYQKEFFILGGIKTLSEVRGKHKNEVQWQMTFCPDNVVGT